LSFYFDAVKPTLQLRDLIAFQGVPIISETSVPEIPTVAKTAVSGIRNDLGEIIIRRAARKTAMALPGDAICGW
jgi:hypothetical protein